MTDIHKPLAIPTTPYITDIGTGTITCERITETVSVIAVIDTAGKFTGQFSVNTATGYSITQKSSCISCAREAAEAIAAIDVDWSDPDVAGRMTIVHREELRDAMAPVFGCETFHSCDAAILASV